MCSRGLISLVLRYGDTYLIIDACMYAYSNQRCKINLIYVVGIYDNII